MRKDNWAKVDASDEDGIYHRRSVADSNAGVSDSHNTEITHTTKRGTVKMNSQKTKYISSVIFFCLLMLAPAIARADAEGIVRYGVTPADLQADFFDGYGRSGYLPVRLTGYRSGNSVRYFTRWIPNTGNKLWYGYFGKTLADFDQISNTLKNQGYYPVDVSGYDTPSGIRYAMIYHKNTAGASWLLYRDTSRAGMQTLVDTIGQQGWVPHRVEAYESSDESYYVSIWYYQPGVGYRMHNKMTSQEYNGHLNNYQQDGYVPVHLDAHTVSGVVYYSGIWKIVNVAWAIRTNRDWRKFQRYYNNYWAAGYNIDNFLAAETPAGVRYGGIWFFDGAPPVNDSSPLSLKIRKEVESAPARGGAAVINVTTGQQVMLHADQEFAIGSTSKIGVLYALLREIDLGNQLWTGAIEAGSQFGTNQGSSSDPAPLTAGATYTIGHMAGLMIRYSNNWATNRLIERLGAATINNHLGALGLSTTRIQRYMTGTGAPSMHGNSSANQDRAEGWENISSPREMVTLLERVLRDNVLSNTSETRFWNTMALDADNDGVNEKSYIASQVGRMFNPPIAVWNKGGSLTGAPRYARADAGRFRFPDGQEVLVAIFMDEISDNPDDFDTASSATISAAEQTIRDVARLVANQFYD
jgi:beta-lactamase class A